MEIRRGAELVFREHEQEQAANIHKLAAVAASIGWCLHDQ
jgi:hypothetical protein